MIVTKDLSSTVHNLTAQQIRDIYSGKVSNWHTLGGPNENIQVVNRKQGSGTRVGFEKYVLGETNPPSRGIIIDTTSDLLAKMSQLKGAIGYVTTTYALTGARNNLFPVCINGFGATETNISRGAYQFWNFEHAYTQSFPLARPITRAFIQYICGSEFQTKDILSNGFLLPDQLTQNAIQTHEQPESSQNCSGDFGP
jgi:phosphate transport system substrate-binding protein